MISNWKNLGLAVFAVAVLLTATAMVVSQQPQGPPGPPPGGGLHGPGGPRDGFGPFGPGGPRDGFGPGPGIPGGPRGGFGPGGPQGAGFVPFGPFGRELNLTDDQRAAMQKIHDNFREGNQALHEQMRALHEGQPDPMSSAFDEAAFRAAAEARAKIQVELEVSRARMMSQLVGLLTAEQRAQLAARHQKMRHPVPPVPPQ